MLATLFLLAFSVLCGAAEKKSALDLELQYREFMLSITRQIGVTCDYCHDPKNFKDASKEAYRISKEHIRLVDWLNKENFLKSTAQKVSCYTCHRGEAKYQHYEKKQK